MKSMTWLRGEWIGFSIGLTLPDVVHCLGQKLAVSNTDDVLCLQPDDDSISSYTGVS